jgi:hypothetical protein
MSGLVGRTDGWMDGWMDNTKSWMEKSWPLLQCYVTLTLLRAPGPAGVPSQPGAAQHVCVPGLQQDLCQRAVHGGVVGRDGCSGCRDTHAARVFQHGRE